MGLSHLLVANSGPDPGTFLIPHAHPEDEPHGLSKNRGDPKIVISMGKTDDNHWILGHPRDSCQECSSITRTSQQSPLEQGNDSMAL